jgi:predicted Zn-dependent peptidase
MFKKITLKNGLRIITVPSKNTQAVTVLVLVATGSKYERKEENGISHFLEHMYFKGTKKRPSSLEIAETLDKVGGIYNAFTSQEYTGYFAKVSKEHFELALDWVSDIFLNSILPEKEVEKERGVIIEEIRMRKDHPMEHVQSLWQKLLYGDQPMGWDVAGEVETVSKIKREDLICYREEQYFAQNTIVCLAGNFNEKAGIEKVKKYFAKIKTGKGREKPKVIEKQKEPEILFEKRDTDQTHICLGVRGVNIFDKRRYTQEILAQILGGMMSSRLFERIRTKLGIAYYIDTESFSDPDTGYLVTRAGLSNEKLEKGILEILKEYRKIKREGVTKSELKKAKDYLKGKMNILLESSDAKASFFATQEILEKRILTPKEIFKKVDKVSQSDVLNLAREIFRPERLNLALIGPNKVKKEILKI